MRVLHVSWEYPPVVHGGLGRHVHALAEAQAAAGHEVVVLTQTSDSAVQDEVVHGVRVVRAAPAPPVVPFDLEHLIAWVMSLEHAMTLRGLGLAGDWAPQVVHAHDWLVAHTAATLKAAFDVPLVATIHATEAGRHQGWLPGAHSRAIHTVEWWLTFEASRVIACSEHMRREVTALFDPPADRVAVIPNGIDLRRWTVPEAAAEAERRVWQRGSGPLVVFTGRLEWEKGVHTLVDAAPVLAQRFPGIRLVIAGRGAQADALAQRVARAGLGATVTFAGFLPEDELVALVAAADTVVVPSLYEPFGLVALEAAALGTPAVVAATGGLAEIVVDGVTGATFQASNAAALADAVSSVLADPSLARSYVASARRRMLEVYGWEAIARRTVATYRNARAETGGHAASTPSELRLRIRDGNLLAGILPA